MTKRNESRICANEECEKTFHPNSFNQIFCGPECCRVSTNKKIMKRYYEKKEKKNRGDRNCKICGTKLNRYNYEDENYCSVHSPDTGGMSKEDLLSLIGFDYKNE